MTKVIELPFRFTMNRDADCPYSHLLYVLKDYCLDFKLRGKSIALGCYKDADYDGNAEYVVVSIIDPLTGNFTGETKRLYLGLDFDEVEYQ